MSRNRIRKSEKREKKMIYEEGKRKLYMGFIYLITLNSKKVPNYLY